MSDPAEISCLNCRPKKGGGIQLPLFIRKKIDPGKSHGFYRRRNNVVLEKKPLYAEKNGKKKNDTVSVFM